MRANEAIGLARGQAPEVCDGNSHLGTGDAVRAALEAHAELPHRHLAHQGLRQTHLQPFGGSLAVLAAHIERAELRVVEASVQHVQALCVAIGAETQGLTVAQAAAVEVFQGGEAEGLQAGPVRRAAHSRHTVGQC